METQYYHLTPKSGNGKTGPIPVSTTGRDSCPSTCPFHRDNMGGCYANGHHLGRHWDKVTAGERGGSLDELCAKIRALPDGQIWRHNQAGDLPGKDLVIDRDGLRKLTAANRGRRGWTYTHKPLTPANIEAIREANEGGFVVNVSTNGLGDIQRAKDVACGPIVSEVPEDYPDDTVLDADGVPMVVCPAQTAKHKHVTCKDCRLCAVPDRKCIVLFKVHGKDKDKATDALVQINM